ncbi:MAG TPA: HAD-IA family hydrolase [Candidatus Acidoferrales bacterium]|jgi:phosphoglycolate phosphatase|nr:HAD-IA family hydrolase [Candidatus Acidoferrales bacterium]
MGDPITRFSEVRALIFDLDGTLIDSKLDLALAVNATLTKLGREPLPHDQIFSYVGRGAPALISRVLGPAASEQDCMLGLEFFVKYYSAHKLDNTTLYPGVRETLDALKGMPMAVYTNKPVRVSRSIIEGLGVSEHFRYVYGGNSFERKKPDPMGVELILRQFGAAPAQTMFVGDSDVDVQTARNSGTWVCGVTYGFGSHRLTDYPPDLLVDNLLELVPYLSSSPLERSR